MAENIEKLVEEKIISVEAAQRLKDAWVSNCDELYSRMKACTFAEKQSTELKAGMEAELGIKQGSFDGFMKYIEEYVSQEVVSAGKPKEHPLGYRI